MKSNLNPLLIIGVVVLLLVVLGGGWMLMNQNNTQQPNTQVQEEIEESELPVDEVEEEGEAEIKTFEVTNQGFKFSPSEIRVSKGDKVRIVYTSSGGSHDWVIDEFGARTKVLQPGQSEAIEFVADQVGTFEFYCDVMNHRQMGMVGKFIVD